MSMSRLAERIYCAINEIMAEEVDSCDGCPFYDRHVEYEPYGEGRAPRVVASCEASDWRECPAIESALDEIFSS